MKSLVVRVVVVALALFALPTVADAGWLANYSGHTFFLNPNTVKNNGTRADGVVNFAVYQTVDSNWTNDFGAVFQSQVKSLIGAADMGAVGVYVYFYQAVNTNLPNIGTDNTLNSLRIATTAPVSSAGYVGRDPLLGEGIGGFTFSDRTVTVAGAGTGPTENARLGSESTVGDPSINGIPSQSGVTPGGDLTGSTGDFVLMNGTPSNSARPIESIEMDEPLADGSGSTGYKFNFTLPSLANSPSNSTKFTSVMFLVSRLEPTYGRANLVDSFYTFGDVPVPTPEPTTLALMGLALPVLGLRYARRLRAGKPVVA